MKGALLLGAMLMVGGAPPLTAQDVSLLVGGVSARYADSVAGSAGMIGGRLRFTRGGSSGTLDASVAQFLSGEWATQLGGQGLWAKPLDQRTAAGLAFGGSFNRIHGGAGSVMAAGGPFLARADGSLLASLALALGRARTVAAETFTVGTATAGIRHQRGALRIEVAAVATLADTLRFADWTAGFSWRHRAVLLDASGGGRTGDLANHPWLQLGVQASLDPIASLEAAAGSYPQDITGFTGGRYVTLGVRLALAGRAPGLATRRGSAVTTRRLDRSRVLVTIALDQARSVAIAGEWNDWSPVAMSRDRSGRWSAVLAVRPGVYRFALLVDGGRWVVPPGAPKAADDFGGDVGYLVIPHT